MFQELNQLPEENRLKYNKAVLIYRALNNLTTDYLTELLTPLSEIRSLNLRSSENRPLHTPLSRTTHFTYLFTCMECFTSNGQGFWISVDFQEKS